MDVDRLSVQNWQPWRSAREARRWRRFLLRTDTETVNYCGKALEVALRGFPRGGVGGRAKYPECAALIRRGWKARARVVEGMSCFE